MKKFLLLVISLFVLILGGCGESKDIQTVKKAYENQLKSEKFRAELIMNAARMRGVNRQSAFSNEDIFNEIFREMGFEDYIRENIEDIIVDTLVWEDNGKEVQDMVSKVYIKEGYLYSIADILEYEGIKVPKAMTLENCDWWEIEKNGKKLVAAGEKTTGYVVFDIQKNKITIPGYYSKNITTKDFEFYIIDKDNDNIVPVGIATFIYLLEDGKLAEIMNH